MKAAAFAMTAVALASLGGCATNTQSDEPLWRDPPALRLPVKTAVKEVARQANSAKPLVLSVVDEAGNTPIPLSLYFVNANEQTVMAVLRRWARAAKVDFSWSSAVDYPITASMRRIETQSFEAAVDGMRSELQGATQPLVISFNGNSLVVAPVESPPESRPVVDLRPVAAAPAPAAVPVVDLRPVAAVPAPAAAPVVDLQPVAAVPAPAAAPVVDLQPVAAAPAPAAAPVVDLRPVAAAPAPAAALVAAPAPMTAPRAPRAVAERQWDTAARAAAGALPMKWSVGNSPSLRSVVEAWGRAAGVRVIWEATADYPVTESVRAGTYAGTFKEALSQLAMTFGQLPVPVGMQFIEQGRAVRVSNI